MTFRPLLAAKADLDKLKFPVYASPKLDGIRAMTGVTGSICSRNLKAIPNRHIQKIAETFPPYLDGEILTYTNASLDDFNTIQSKVMSADGEPRFKFHVFDWFGKRASGDHAQPFSRRAGMAERLVFDTARMKREFPLFSVPQHVVNSIEELTDLETRFVEKDGWEGVMLRSPDGPYKFGRSTVNEGILLKVKRFEDDEAIVLDTVERFHNSNEATTNALGLTERSSSKAGKVGTDTLGALVCEWKGIRFEIGTGFNEAQRAEYWGERDALPGRTVTFKFQGVGSQGAPRFPVFLGFRSDLLV